MINENYRFPKLSIIFLSILPFSFIISPSRYLAVLHINIVFILAVIAFVIIELIMTKSKISRFGISAIIALCTITVLIGTIKSVTKEDFSEALSLIFIMLLYFFISINKYDNQDVRFLFNFIIFFGLSLAVLLMLRAQGYTDVFGTYHADRKSFTNLTHTLFDPNFLSSSMVIPAIIAFYKIFYSDKILFKIVYAGMFAIIIVGILITGSRSAFVGLAAGLFVTFTHVLINRYNKSKTHIFIIFLLIIVVLIAAVIIFLNLPEYILKRYFTGNYLDKSNTERIRFWIESFDIIKEKPFFGYGMQHYLNIKYEFTGLDRDVHNTYLTLLFFFGMFGIIPFAMFFIYFAFKNLKKQNIFIIGILLSFFIMSFIISSHRSLYFVSTFSFLIILLNYQEQNKNINLDEILN